MKQNKRLVIVIGHTFMVSNRIIEIALKDVVMKFVI